MCQSALPVPEVVLFYLQQYEASGTARALLCQYKGSMVLILHWKKINFTSRQPPKRCALMQSLLHK